jgi:hypothetical protein
VSQRFLILHGLEGSGDGHWQVWLAQRLRQRDEWVSFPDLPDPARPSLAAWDQVLGTELAALADGEGDRVVVCHSLGGILWLQHAARIERQHRPQRVLLVAPPSGSNGPREIAEFVPVHADRAVVAAAADRTLIVCSDDDPYCPEGADLVYGEPLGIETEVIPGAGHLNPEAGYGPWPHVEAWCLCMRTGVAW